MIDDDENETCLQSRRGYARLLSSQKQYEAAFNQYKQIDVSNSVEDIFSLAKFFYNLGKYQKCAQSRQFINFFFENILKFSSI